MASPDMSVMVKRNPENQTYKVDLLVVKQDGAFESRICRNLIEVMQAISEFESKHLPLFEGDIEYSRVDWRELARQNRQAQQTPVPLTNPNREQSK